MNNLQELMKLTGIQTLTAEMLPEFEWRIGMIGQATGNHITLDPFELVKQQGLFAIGAEELSRKEWLAVLDERIEAMEAREVNNFHWIGDLVRHHFGNVNYEHTITLHREFGLVKCWYMLRLSDGSTTWLAVYPNSYRLASDIEQAELIRTLASVAMNTKETKRESRPVAV